MSLPSYSALAGTLTPAYERAGLPWLLGIDATFRCDLNCRHCYLDNRTTWPEMNSQELHGLVDQAADLGVAVIVWSGGEIFARPDLEDLLAHAAQRGIYSRLKTHAGNVDRARAERLAHFGVVRVDVSVYSLRAAIHDAFTRTPGSLQRTLAGIDHLRAAGLAVRISSSVQPQTVDEMPDLHRHFTSLGCSIVFSTQIFRDNHGNVELDALQMHGEDLARAERWRALLTGPSERPAPLPAVGDTGTCVAGRTYAYVTPDGAVWPCVNWPMALGNLREQPLAAIWHGSERRHEIVAWRNRDRTTCMTCGGSGFCFYCPGEAFKTSGDYRKAPPQFHERARARMEGFAQATGESVAAELATTPAVAPPPPRPARFVFPIYRPQKGNGARVVAPVREARP